MEEKAEIPKMEDQDEAEEETLSFCDLPIYSNAAECQNLSKQCPSLALSSSNNGQEDLFEFFSEDWNSFSSSSFSSVQGLVFCGKLIPFKEPISTSETTHKPERVKQQKTKKRCRLIWWNLKLFTRHRRSKHCNANQQKFRYVPVAKGGFSVRRLSCLTSPAKSWWHLLMFGLAKMPTEMEMSDIKSRQNRRSPPALFRPSGGDEEVKREKGLWWLIRALGCGGGLSLHQHHTNAVVKT